MLVTTLRTATASALQFRRVQMGLETLAYRVDPAKTVLATVRLRAKRRCLPLCTNSLKRQNRLVA